MNKNCYKVIFNQHKGCMTAVPEYASRHSKYSADRTSSSSISRFGIKQFAFFMMAAVGTAWVLPSQAADIQADRHAPANQQPVVLQTANGLPQVNIQTPTTGGVSVNQYQQFDVSRRGAILNNSRRNTQTRLGGWIQGNPMLAGGEARIIVNQVNSSNPSLLNGYIETAGKRAEVVIANPSGIQVDGGGFINAAGVTLTTGKPLIGNGGLEGFQVREGRVSVSGEGLDGSTADYTRILTQAAEINGRVWAKDLNITAGRFDMAADGSVQAAGSGENSETAIDTGVLGGMYAGKITLTATDKGVGVNNAGEIYASAGSVVLSADGKISNSGRIIGKGDTAVNARSLDNSGALSSQNTADIQTASLSNSGMIASAKEARIRNSGKFDNSGKLNAARLDVETASLANSGEISQSGAQSLNIEAKHAENTGLIGYRDTASIPNTDSSNAHSQSSATGSADSAASSFGNQSNPQPKQASGRLKISDGLGNSGDITANGVTHLNINSGFNNRKDIKVGKFTQQTGRFDNSANFYAAEATIQADRAANSGTWAAASADITAGELDNSGSVQANALNINAKLSNTDTIEAGSLNIDGNIRNSGRLNTDRITARSQTLDNSQGRITAHQSGSLTVSDGLNNDGGQIHSQGNLDIGDNRADTLEVRNNQGSILAGNDLNIQAKSLDNSGTTRANRDTVIKLKESFANSKTLESGRLLSLESAGTISNSGTLRGGRSLKVKAAALHNHGTAESGSDTRLEAENTLVNTGLANSGGLTAVKGRDIDNSGRIYGDHVAVGGENLRNRENSSGKAGVIAARRHLAIGAKKIDNIGSGFDKIVEGKQQLGNASSLIASLGTLSIGGRLNDAYHAEGKAQTLNNRGAKIESVGDMDLSVDSIRNVNNRLEIEEKVAEGESRYVKAYSLPGNAEWWVEGKDGHFWQTGDDAKGQFDFKDGRGSLKYKVWNEKEVTIRTHADLLVHSEPGQIIAGGNFKVDTNNLLNKDSQILIGGRWHGESKNSVLDNDSIAQKRYEVETGRGWQSYSHKSKKDLKFKWVRRGRGDYGINSTRYLPEQAFGNDFEHYQENSTFSTQIGNIESANNRTKSADITANQTGSVRTLNADPRLPNSALFAVNPDHPTHLVETDPAFTDYKQWLSGDYMLKALAVDPASTHKRLGDGYYEQRLVNEQIAKLTGYRRLDGYGSDEEQFKALMDAGITVAKQFNLVPGIALTSEQVALLTSDILWLENQTVTLADGSTKTVLAPKVYTVVRKGDLNAAGGLISASAIALKAENIDNQGTLGTRETVRLDAQNIRLGGNVASSAVVATASDGLQVDGKVEAENLIALKAKDISIASSTASAGDERNGSTSLNRQAGLHLNGSQGGRGMVAVDASGKLSINGADIRNAASDGLTVLQGKDVHIGTVQTETREAYGELSDNIHRHARIRKEHGSRIEAAGDIRIFSDGQTDIRQADIASSKGKVTVYGKDGVSVAEGRKQSSADEAYTSKKNKIVSKTTSEIRKQSDYDEAVGSSLQGKEVYIGSQGGILVRGSEVVSDNKTVIDGKNVTLEAAVNAYQNNSDIRTKKSGFSGRLGKKGVQIGYNRHRSETENDGITQDVSTANIGSIGGDTVIRATDTLATRAAVVGSGGNLILEGKNIDIGSLYTGDKFDSQTRSKSRGINIGVAFDPVPMEVRNFGNHVKGWREALKEKGADGKIKGWVRGDTAAAAETFSNSSGTRITHGRMKRQQGIDDTYAHGSQIRAGGMVDIRSGEDTRISGSEVYGKKGLAIDAGRRLDIETSEQNQSSYQKVNTKTHGMVSAGTNTHIGYTFETAENTDKRSSHLSSNVGSGGDILLKAGEVYNQRGSHIRADGNTHILAKNVNVEAAEAAYLVSDKESYTRKGINVGVGSPAVNAINNAKQSIQSTAKQTENIGESKNSRTNAMAAVNAGIGAYRAVKDVQTAYQSVRNGKGFKPTINITYGEQRNTAEQSQQGHTVSPSGIQAGGKVMIEAAGADKASTITVSGSDVAGQQGTALLADGDVRLHSAQEAHQERSRSRRAGFNAGVAITVDSGVSLGVTAGGNYGKGRGDGNNTGHRHSSIGSSESRTQIRSGGHTAVEGAQVFGKGIDLDTKSLSITSPQDTAVYDGKHYQGEVQITVGYGFAAGGSAEYSRLKADHAGTTRQSGLFAGDDGFQVNVAEHTRLKGGLITATEQAESEGKNRFQTATIDTEDIRNHSRYEGQSYGIGISGSMGGGEGRQQIGSQKLTAYGNNTVTRTDNGDTVRQGRASVSAQIGFGRDSDSRESTTPSGIGTRNLTVTADPAAAATLYTDIRTETAAVSSGRLNNTFDKERVQKELDIQREVTQQFGSNIGYVKSRVNQRIEGLKAAREAGRISQEEYDKQTAKLEMAKLLTDSVAMGLMTPSNSLGGTLLTAASPIASREIGAYFKTVDPQTGKDKQGTPAHIMAHTVWNAAVAYATGNNAGTAALAAGGSETVTPILSNWLFKEKDPSKLTEDQKETLATINRLLGSGIGAAGGNADNALSDGLIARNVAEQNNMTRAGKGVVVPLFGALYCALDKHCGSVTDTFTGMMSEQIKSAQEEREKLFPILNDGKGGGEKAQVPKHPVSRSATGAPMPPDDEDGKQSPYENAKNGGKHSGFYRQHEKLSIQEIKKGINSLEKQIDIHQKLIRNPDKVMKELNKGDWKSLDVRQQNALINKKWPSDISRQMEQKNILEGILKQRGLK